MDANGTKECTKELGSNITRAGKRFGGFKKVVFGLDSFEVIWELVLHGRGVLASDSNDKG